MQADIGEAARPDGSERLGHAVDEGLDANEPGLRRPLGFRDQMLAAAEADFESYRLDAWCKQGREVVGRRRVEVECQSRQQGFEQCGLLRPQRMALAAAEKGARRPRLIVYRRNHSCCHARASA